MKQVSTNLSLQQKHIIKHRRSVTAVGAASYAYDNNGNMTTRGTQTITWDVENRPVTIVDGANTSTFVYDGDSKRGKRTEGGETVY